MPYFQVDVFGMSDFRCVYVCMLSGLPLDHIEKKKPQRALMKGIPAGALGQTTQWWNNHCLLQPKSSARVVLKGRGWELVGGGLGRLWSQQCVGTAFSSSEQSQPLHSYPEMQIAHDQSFTLGFQRTKCK